MSKIISLILALPEIIGAVRSILELFDDVKDRWDAKDRKEKLDKVIKKAKETGDTSELENAFSSDS